MVGGWWLVISASGLGSRRCAGTWVRLLRDGWYFGLGKKAVASGEWLVARSFWILWYLGLRAVGNWALGDV